MRRLAEIAREEAFTGTLVELTSAFEGIASMRIAQIKDQVEQSTQFFDDLWHIYAQLRAGNVFSFGRTKEESPDLIDKELLIIITSEGGLSGDIDQKLVELMLKSYDKEKNDVIVIGRHGAVQLAQRGVSYKHYFKLPKQDRNINVAPIERLVQQYRTTRLFYQQYVSLMVQDVRRIELSNAVEQRGSATTKPDEIIDTNSYIFEPSAQELAAHLERSMTKIAIAQLILESKLAQYASRFRAMTASHERADDDKRGLHIEFNRARRALKDERLKEVINGLKKSRLKAGN
jgi:F-type H+-transporting ATPase subunit gamma